MALLEAGGTVCAQGAQGASTALLAGVVAQRLAAPVLLVTAHLDEADEAVEALRSLGVEAALFPALELTGAGLTVSPEALAQRLEVVQRLSAGASEKGFPAPGGVLVAPVQGLLQAAPTAEAQQQLLLRLARNGRVGLTNLVRWLDAAGYSRVEEIEEPGDFAVRGGVVDVFALGAPALGAEGPTIVSAVRVDFFGDEIESLHVIDLDSMGVDEALERVDLISADAEAAQRAGAHGASLLELLPQGVVAMVWELVEALQQARGFYERAGGEGVVSPPRTLELLQRRTKALALVGQLVPTRGAFAKARRVELPLEPAPTFSPRAGEAARELLELACEGEVLVACERDAEASRLGALLDEAQREEGAASATIRFVRAALPAGFVVRSGDGAAVAALGAHEVLGRSRSARLRPRLQSARARDAFIEMQPGDLVVHAEHGIGRYLGLETARARRLATRWDESDDAGLEERLVIEFAKGVRVRVPVAQIDKVQKHIGAFRGEPPLSTVGSTRWRTQKEKVRQAVRDLAAQLLRVQALREHAPGVAYPEDTPWQREFEAAFPFEETEDQLAALAEIKRDMRRPRPMDRLLCGDVGFGKTELAIRAAFKTVEYGKQVAVVAPTTVLVEQHERVFRERFAGYPFCVESLSRLKSPAQQREILRRLARGQVDVVVGTHRLLSKDVRFADLGLLVVDEEQRFGVEHKQRLLEQRATVDVLTMTATPIPRTLHMSMLGLRDISSLTTPPLDRRAIVTEVAPWSDDRVRQAIERELAREGQVYVVHNRVRSIERMAQRIRELAPEARVVVGHGQMPPRQLEQVMLRFVRGQADVLVCTTIIESGVDIPNANTMLITDADRFGLAELHQLRGRVGRRGRRAHCLLLLPEDRVLTSKARQRLKAIEQFNMLGAGFRIAMRDLEIRGAGNLLGPEQSGHIAAVGYDMYCRLLEQEARKLQGETAPEPVDTTVDLGVTGMLPSAYIPSEARRLDLYRRLSQARSLADVEAAFEAMRSAYGQPPTAARRLFDLARVRVAAAELGARSIRRVEGDVVALTAEPEPLARAFGRVEGVVRTLRDRSGLWEVRLRPGEADRSAAAALALLVRALASGEAGERCAATTASRSSPG